MHGHDFTSSRGTLRQRALERLSALSVKPTDGRSPDHFSKLCALYHPPTVSPTANGVHTVPKLPMGIRELEVLLSLCRAAALVPGSSHAYRLTAQLGPYLEEIGTQHFKASPHMKGFQPSPWELVAHDVTAALLVLASAYPDLRATALGYIKNTVNTWLVAAPRIIERGPAAQQEHEDNTDAETEGECVRLCLVMIGTMTALSENASALTPPERFSLLQEVHAILSENFMESLENSLARLRNSSSHYKDARPWKRVLTTYASTGRPLGALILQQCFMRLIAASVELFVSSKKAQGGKDALTYLTDAKLPLERFEDDIVEGAVDKLAGYVVESLAHLEADASFLRVTSGWQQRLAFSMKAYALKSFLYLSLFEDNADADTLMGYLEAVIADQTQLADDELAQTTLKCMVVIAKTSSAFASALGRSLPHLIAQGRMTAETANVAADCLARVMTLLPQDVLISTLYTLANMLIAGSRPTTNDSNLLDTQNGSLSKAFAHLDNRSQASSISIETTDIEDMATTYATVVNAIVYIAMRSKDDKIIRLAVSLLLQKIDRLAVISMKIVKGVAQLGLLSSPSDLRTIARLYTRISARYTPGRDEGMLAALLEARLILAHGIKKDSPLYEVYLVHLLDAVVGTTGPAQAQKQSANDHVLAAQEIGQYLEPLAVLTSSEPEVQPEFEDVKQITNLARDAWYNLVAHDFTLGSRLATTHQASLETIALYSPSLVGKDRVEVRESSLELNTVLRRNMNPSHTTEQRQALVKSFPDMERQIAALEYSELTFLNAAHLIAVLRARAGSCTRTLEYFNDTKFKSGDLGAVLEQIAVREVDEYLRHTLAGKSQTFSTSHLAAELVVLLQGCCHRIAKVRQVAMNLAHRIITRVPAALCQRSSVFAMLELLTLMWNSCLDEETEDVEWQTTYTSKRGGVSIELSDDFLARRTTLDTLLRQCKQWLRSVVEVMPLDMKALLQTYLSDFQDEGAYGHVALGRSVATEIGCIIPKHDLRIGNMDTRLDIGINSASEFIAQYTTRQQYRTIDGMFDGAGEARGLLQNGASDYILVEDLNKDIRDAVDTLRSYAETLRADGTISMAQLKPALSKAAALLCRSDVCNRELAHLLVEVPCQVWTKDSVKFAVSLWMGVIRENANVESQILLEVLAQHDLSVRAGRTGLTPSPQQTDPFYGKHEFAPSDRGAIKRREAYTSDIISPVVRIYQFLVSHFHATRFAAPIVSRAYLRTMQMAALEWAGSDNQPITREMHFRWVLSAFKVTSAFGQAGDDLAWMTRDATLSYAFKWFAMPPRWSFGGNKLQIKADLRVMTEILGQIDGLKRSCPQATGARRSLIQRYDLLQALVQDECQRLTVWLTPLEVTGHHGLHLLHHHKAPEGTILPLILTAWLESPSVAIQLVNRFRSDRTIAAVRELLVKDPERALDEPEAIPILLGIAGPSDTPEQQHIRDLALHGKRGLTANNPRDKYLKYLLYWAAVNPITAATYLMPTFGDHPSVVQYAVRALEWHSVDITFFFVPQIVQALRHDNLGYVQRYIVETAKLSQLFAHQIIWNIKANAYKDEDSQVPDPMKPTLDIVMDALIASFSTEDRDFYVREFDFFDKVTGISGTLKPLIKRPKPEKKQKIEEELRKIKVDVGVYLPSNPDGVVVGIDRQSGKPLQSHAKAPYMATFRIRRERKDDFLLAPKAGHKATTSHHHNVSIDTTSGAVLAERKDQYYETWQSAIFKVGDDCRQDVLALQLISTFRSIFATIGLDVYVFPYRVTATAPGCGVIDVLPNSISRDMLGREQVNGLYEYFLSHFGTEDSLAFQAARANFVKSMAAYSVISYLLQFKDRHNGNIMIDDQGHILHIDFGFLFDIAPGGVKFERSPFKLTGEMVAVMGGVAAAPYRRFEELCVKAFLAARPFADKLASLVVPMLESGLPCFKPETVRNLRDRFVLDKTDREAAEFMRGLVRKSEGSLSTKGYDQFQLLTNGIPY